LCDLISLNNLAVVYFSITCSLGDKMASLRVGQMFDNFVEAETAVAAFCKENFHPTRIESRETIQSANKKVTVKSQITDMNPDDIYSCRLEVLLK